MPVPCSTLDGRPAWLVSVYTVGSQGDFFAEAYFRLSGLLFSCVEPYRGATPRASTPYDLASRIAETPRVGQIVARDLLQCRRARYGVANGCFSRQQTVDRLDGSIDTGYSVSVTERGMWARGGGRLGEVGRHAAAEFVTVFFVARLGG